MTDAWDGRPENPERDGWHWVAWAGNAPDPTFWTPHAPERRGACWHWDDEWMGPGWVAANAEYVGPCLTPAEVAAQVAAAVTAEREVWKNVVDVAAIWLTAALECPSFVWDGDQHDAVTQTRDELNAILARPAPSGADALAAMLAAARREGIEAAAACVRTACVAFANDHSADGPPAYSAAMTIEAAIRALLPAPDTALARDFAAWTEGESDG